MNKYCLLLLLFFCIIIPVHSQTIKSREQFVVLNLSQIRENLNYGFVFTGPQLHYGRNWQWKRKSVQYVLESKLGAAVLSEKGSCYDFQVSPVNFDCLLDVSDLIQLGPCFLSDYNYEFYPDLQAGHDFWFTHYSTGISLIFRKAFTNRILNVKFKSALFGFISRTPDDFDALFFNVGFKYAVKDLHKNMQFSTFNRYRVFRFEASLKPLEARRIDVSAVVDYMNYDSSPSWKRLNYGLKFSIHPKTAKS